jgi:hypothetical protein
MKKRWWGKKQTIITVGVAGGALLAAFLIGLGVWVSNPLKAAPQPLNLARNMATVRYADTRSAVVLTPTNPSVGLIVYPDSRVDPAAYAYKMSEIALHGAAVVIVKTWFNYPLIDTHNIAELKALVPTANGKDWYVAGHGAGGAKACQVSDQFKGLVLLGATCTDDISKSSTKVLSIAGGADKIVTAQNIDAAKHLLPSSATFDTIDGLNHTGFGDYGLVSNDNESTITSIDARQKISDLISPFIGATQ